LTLLSQATGPQMRVKTQPAYSIDCFAIAGISSIARICYDSEDDVLIGKADKCKGFYITRGKYISKSPSVKYRGIFINDEDWGFLLWSGKTFDPELGNIGPKTYEKV
jgi:hypothetical protein